MSRNEMISLDHVTRRYGSFVAVNDISLSVREGEIFGFLGVNGAGKTTSLRMMAGILRPTNGTIKIGGYDVVQDPMHSRVITGYIPDRPHLYNKLTAREYLYFIADLYNVPAKETDERVDELLERYGLGDWQNELVEGFSHGMKQRLATCAALVHKPKVLIVDEPMVGLDPHGAKLFKDCMREYAKQGMAILLSTHSLNVAEELSDRLAIIHRGSIIVAGTLADLREHIGAEQDGLENMFLQITSQVVEH